MERLAYYAARLRDRVVVPVRARHLHRRQAIVTCHGVKVRLGEHCTAAIAAALVGGWYEAPEWSLLRAILGPHDRVLEVGAGIGFTSAFCAQRLPRGRVLAFEANPALIQVALDTYALNDVEVAIENAVLGDAGGAVTFYVEPNLCSSSLSRRSPGAREVTVPLIPLAQVLAAHRPDLMIVDIEGGEVELLRTSELPGVRKLLIELHPAIAGGEAIADLERRLAMLGFREVRRLVEGVNRQVCYARPG